MENKYHAKKITNQYGIFDSKKECLFFMTMMALKKAVIESERVKDIERQVRYDIVVNGTQIGFYKLDFKVTYANGNISYVDIKGLKKGCAYQLFRLKKKLVESLYGITITEI